jgi:hypothetical protein
MRFRFQPISALTASTLSSALSFALSLNTSYSRPLLSSPVFFSLQFPCCLFAPARLFCCLVPFPPHNEAQCVPALTTAALCRQPWQSRLRAPGSEGASSRWRIHWLDQKLTEKPAASELCRFPSTTTIFFDVVHLMIHFPSFVETDLEGGGGSCTWPLCVCWGRCNWRSVDLYRGGGSRCCKDLKVHRHANDFNQI